MNFDAIPLFSSPVFSIKIKENTNELKKANDSYIVSSMQDYKNSQKKSFNEKSTHRILEDYPKIKNIIMSYWEKLIDDILHKDCKFIITTSWITKTVSDELSQFHWHKNSYYSGVYYYDEYDENSASLLFTSPVQDKYDFHIPNFSKNNIFNSNMWEIKPEKNLLVFFPSYLNHQVYLHKSDKPRYSLAFNIIPVGFYGQGDSTIDTNWIIESSRKKLNSKNNSKSNLMDIKNILNKGF